MTLLCTGKTGAGSLFPATRVPHSLLAPVQSKLPTLPTHHCLLVNNETSLRRLVKLSTQQRDKCRLLSNYQNRHQSAEFEARLWAAQIDFNLFGMGFMKLGQVHFSSPVPAVRGNRRAGWHPVETLVHHEVSPSGKLCTILSSISAVRRQEPQVPRVAWEAVISRLCWQNRASELGPWQP